MNLEVVGTAHVFEYAAELSLSEILGKSNLIPALNKDGQKYSVHDIFVLAMIGKKIGIDPMSAIMGIYIVQGRPFIGAKLTRGLILRNGHTFNIAEWTATKITVSAARKGQAPTEFSYTTAEAAHAGLMKKDTWSKHPRRMLLAAVTRNVADALFADLFLGVTSDDGSDDDILVDNDDDRVDRAPGSDRLALAGTKKATLNISELRSQKNDRRAHESLPSCTTREQLSAQDPDSPDTVAFSQPEHAT